MRFRAEESAVVEGDNKKGSPLSCLLCDVLTWALGFCDLDDFRSAALININDGVS